MQNLQMQEDSFGQAVTELRTAVDTKADAAALDSYYRYTICRLCCWSSTLDESAGWGGVYSLFIYFGSSRYNTLVSTAASRRWMRS